MPDFSPNNPYSNESTEERAERENRFAVARAGRNTIYDDYDPEKLYSLGQTAEEVWEVEQKFRQGYDNWKQQNKDVSQGVSFGQWALGWADNFRKEDPTEARKKGYDPVLFAELAKEFADKEQRYYTHLYEQEFKEKGENMGAVERFAQGSFNVLKGFADTITADTMDTTIMAVGEAINEGYAARYQQGLGLLDEMNAAGPFEQRWAQSLGNLAGYVIPAQAAGKAATIGRTALEGGKTALKEGTRKYAISKGLLTFLGAPGKNPSFWMRSLSSAGNMATTSAGLQVIEGFNRGAQAALANDAKDPNNDLSDWDAFKQGMEEGHEGLLTNFGSSLVGGAMIPGLNKFANWISTRGLKESSKLFTEAWKDLSRSDKVSKLLRSAFAGSAEFAGFAFSPHITGHGIHQDLYAIAFGEEQEKSQAWENVWMHVLNGLVMGGKRGFEKGHMRYSMPKREQVSKALGGEGALTLAETVASAEAAASDKLYIPTQAERDALRSKNDTKARTKIANFVLRKALERVVGPEMGEMTIGEGMTRAQAQLERSGGWKDFQKSAQDAVNRAIDIVGQQGKAIQVVGQGPKIMVDTVRGQIQSKAALSPTEAKQLHRRVKKEILRQSPENRDNPDIDAIVEALLQRTGALGRRGGKGLGAEEGQTLSRHAKKRLRKAVKELLEQDPELKGDALFHEVLNMTAFTEASARMGGQEIPEGQQIIKPLIDEAARRTQAELEAVPPEKKTVLDKLNERTLKWEALKEQIDQTADIGEKRALAEQTMRLEAEMEQLRKGLQAEQQRETQQIEKEQWDQLPEDGSSIQKPLSVGEKPEPVDPTTAEKSDLQFPGVIVEAAGGTRVRIQVGTYDKEGIFRPATITKTSPDAFLAQTGDGKYYRITPDDVKAGRARGGILSNIPEGPGDYPSGRDKPIPKDARDEMRRVERKEITDRGDIIESMEYREPDPMFGRAPTDAADNILFDMRHGKPGEGSREDMRALREFLKDQYLEADAANDSGRTMEAWRLLGEVKKARGIGDDIFVTEDHPKYPRPGEEEGPAPQGAKPKPKPGTGGGAARLGSKKATPKKPAPKETPAEEEAPKAKPAGKARLGSKRKAKKAKQTKGLRKTVEEQQRRIEELKGKEQAAVAAKYRDERTGLANADAWEAAKARYEGKKNNAVWTGDLGNFKELNDTHGHEAGNAALKQTAKHLLAMAKKAGIPARNVFRTGGDEFTVGGTREQIAEFGRLMQEQNRLNTPQGAELYIDGATGARLSDADASAKRAKDARKKAAGLPTTRGGSAEPAGTPSPKGKASRLGSRKAKPKKATKKDLRERVKELSEELGIDVTYGRTVADLEKQIGDLERRQTGKVGEKGEDVALTRKTGQTKRIQIDGLPEGWQVQSVIKSGRNWTAVLNDPDGGTWLARSGKIGVTQPGADWKPPAATRDLSVVDKEGNIIHRGPTTVGQRAVGDAAPPDNETGRLTNVGQARKRLAAFSRRKPEEVRSKDPVRGAFVRTGAMLADENLTSEDVAREVKNLESMYRRRRDEVMREFKKALSEKRGKEARDELQKRWADESARIEAAIDAGRMVKEAKKYVEDFEKKRRTEEEFLARGAAAVNPAKRIDLSDEALSASQKRIRDLAQEYISYLDTETERQKKRRATAKKVGDENARRKAETTLRRLRDIKKVANKLLENAPHAAEHTSTDISTSALPPIAQGDKVTIVYGGERGSRMVEGLVVGAGTPTSAALKRGRGKEGQEARKLARQKAKKRGPWGRRGSAAARAEAEAAMRGAALWPGKWLSIFTTSGELKRVRVSDISEVGPTELTDELFAYDPQRDRFGTEVSERRFMSWFGTPETIDTSRMPSGTGDAEQSVMRVGSLLAGDRGTHKGKADGTYVIISGRGKDATVRDLTGLEAAEMEAKVRASQIRNQTITPEQAMLEANAYLVDPKNRKGLEFDVVTSDERTGKKDKLPYRVHYYEPGTKLRNPESLPEDHPDRVQYDHWVGEAEKAEARRMRAQEADGTYGKLNKQLIPMSMDEDAGEFIFRFRSRQEAEKEGEEGTWREGKIIYATRTPTGTVHLRRMFGAEAKKWLEDRGRGEEWETWKKQTANEQRRMRTKNRRIIQINKGNTMLKEYNILLYNQLERIAKDPDYQNEGRFRFPGEGDVHKMTREWLEENPYPGAEVREPYSETYVTKDGKTLTRRVVPRSAWEREFENFLFRLPSGEKEFGKGSFKDKFTGQVFQPVGQEDFFGKNVEGAGPLYIAFTRVARRQNPVSGDQLIYDENTGQVRYKDAEAYQRDFYKLWAADRGIKPEERHKWFQKDSKTGIYLNTFGVGNLGSARFWREMFSRGVEGVRGAGNVIDWMNDKYLWATKKPATIWSDVMEGVTDFTKGITDTVLFDHIHELLHNPEFGSDILPASWKATARKVGILFGEGEAAPFARLHLNDYEGALYRVGADAHDALVEFRKLDPKEQWHLAKEYEAGRTPDILKPYQEIANQIARDLIDVGLMDPKDFDRFAGKWIHYGRWVWKQGDVQDAIKSTEDEILSKKQDGKTPQSELAELRKHLNMLKSVKIRTLSPGVRGYLGAHPLSRVSREEISALDKGGYTRRRSHKSLEEAKANGLDDSEPWALFLEGILTEGRALAQARMYEAMATDPSIVRDVDTAPDDWVRVSSSQFSKHPVWSRFQGKAVDPQAFYLMEAESPDYRAKMNTWDMLHGLAKSGYTVYNFGNWQTQVLGNAMILASTAKGVPWFQLPSRMWRSLRIIAGSSDKYKELREQYREWNWINAENDATREMLKSLRRGALTGGVAATDNPYVGMNFVEVLSETFNNMGRTITGKGGRAPALRRTGRGVGKMFIDGFTALDGMARITYYEWLKEQGYSTQKARIAVDKLYDIKHLPKGWQFNRRFLDSFASIKALMGRNLAELAPASPAALVNMGTGVAMWNMVMKALYGYDDEAWEKLKDSTLPKDNAFHEWYSDKVTMAAPQLDGTLGMYDMSKFSPTDVGIRGIPGLRQGVSGAEALVAAGEWQDDMRGKNIAQGIGEHVSGNVLYGPTINYAYDEDPFSPGRSLTESYPGPLGFLQYQLERGPFLPILTGMSKPLRQLGPAASGMIVKPARRFAQAKPGGMAPPFGIERLRVKPRIDVRFDKEGKLTADRWNYADAIQYFMGYRGSNDNPITRQRELLARTGGTRSGEHGLARTRQSRLHERGTEKGMEAKEAVSGDRQLSMLNSTFRLYGLVRMYENGNESVRKKVGPLITETIGSRQTLTKMMKNLGAFEQNDVLDKLRRFFRIDAHKSLIPKPERPSRPDRSRFGNLRGGD